MKVFQKVLIVGLGLLAFAPVVGAQDAQKQPRFEEKIVVTAAPKAGNGSEFILTFSGPVAVPGVSLPAGTYLFRFPLHGAKAIQVLAADRTNAYALFLTIPIVDATRDLSSETHQVTWKEQPAGAPPAIQSWFLPGERVGYEFVYPQAAVVDTELRFEEGLVVTASPKPRSESEYFMTFSGPVAVPGVTLGAGSYLFRFPVAGSKVIQVLKADGSDSYALFHTIPIVNAQRSGPTAGHEVTLKEGRADAPPAIKAWFVPGQSTGYEFVYPTEAAQR